MAATALWQHSASELLEGYARRQFSPVEVLDELYARIEGGAHVYVCGDASRMARDVDRALADVLVAHGGIDRERAGERLAQLASEGRYARDVY